MLTKRIRGVGVDNVLPFGLDLDLKIIGVGDGGK
jgi:hypothetical protein